jgi:hypothetical protein
MASSWWCLLFDALPIVCQDHNTFSPSSSSSSSEFFVNWAIGNLQVRQTWKKNYLLTFTLQEKLVSAAILIFSYFLRFIWLSQSLVFPQMFPLQHIISPLRSLEKAWPKTEQAKVSEIGLCCFFTQKMVKVKKEKRLTSQDLDQFLAKLFTMLGLRPYSQLSQQIMYAWLIKINALTLRNY